MKNIKSFLSAFKKRDGLFIVGSTFISKFSAIVLSLIVVRLLTKEEFGNISSAYAIVNTLLVFSGLGLNWSILRYGPHYKSFTERRLLYNFTSNYGLVSSIVLIGLVVTVSYLFPSYFDSFRNYLIIISLLLITLFLFENTKSYFRIIGINKLYAYANITFMFISLIIITALSYFGGAFGYSIALVSAPLITFLYFRFKFVKKVNAHEISINKSELTKYGLHTGFGVLANQILLNVGVLMLSYFDAASDEIASYRVATLIPYNLMIIPSVFMETDFVHISKNTKNPSELISYYKNYLGIIFLISIPIFIILYFSLDPIMILLFSTKYAGVSEITSILLIGIIFSFFFRSPLGNILAAVGKANWNVYNAYFSLGLNVILNLILYPKYHLKGLAYSTVISFIITGFIQFILFYYYIWKLKVK